MRNITCSLRSRIASAFLMLGMELMGAAEVGAQAIAPVGVSSRRVIAGSNVIPIAVPTHADSSGGNSLSERMLLGLGGSVVGVLVGGSIGLALPKTLCRCEDPEPTQALVGAAVGSIVVAVVAAAIPELGSNCGFERRTATGVAVSAIGAAVGGAIGVLTGSGGVAYGYLIGAGLGAGLGTRQCGR